MRLVLDLRIYGPKYGGLGRYNQKLLEHLISLDRENEYIILIKTEHKIDLPILPANFSAKICDCHWYSLAEQWQLPKILNRLQPDLVHFPHFNIPYFYRGKFIVTIHDLIMTKFPSRRASTLNKFLFAFKRLAYDFIISRAVNKAVKIITVSQFSAADIKQYFRLTETEAKKISVVYEGVNLPEIINTEEVKLPEKYLLYVGNAYPHKNLEFLIASFKEFHVKHPEYSLILVGNKNHFYQQLEKFAAATLGENKDKVILAGFVPDKKLGNYYQQATAYIFPSNYEGFGLPPLEAMAYGLPVLSAKTSCLPEVLGSAALYFDPQSQSDLLASLEIIISDNDLRDRLRQRGYEQIKLYSWQIMAEQILKIYNSL